MLSTYYISQSVPAELWDRYSAMEIDMIIAFARRARDYDFTTQWYANKLQAMGILREDLEQVIRTNWPMAQQELSKVMEQAGFKSLSANERIYQRAVKAGLIPAAPPIAESVMLRQVLQAGYAQTLAKLETANKYAVNSTTNLLQAIMPVSDAATLAATGFSTLRQSVDRAVAELASNGITGIMYPSGRRMELAPYVRSEIVTQVGNTTRELSFTRAKEFGTQLIQISAHAGARPKCFPYQGRVFSLVPGHPKYPHFYTETSYGDPGGLFGINCRHFQFPFIEGLDTEPTAEERDPAQTDLNKSNAQVYRESQQQRAIERRIREWKTRSAALEEAGIDSTGARAKVKEWQARQREFINNTGRTRRYDREKAGGGSFSVQGIPQSAVDIANRSFNSVRARGLSVPSTIRADAEVFRNAPRAPAAYRPSEDTLFLNPGYAGYSQLAERSRKNYLSGMWSTDNAQQIFWHEIGHSVAYKNGNDRYAALRGVGRQPMSLNSRINDMIAKEVSYYATFSPAELVAEVFAGLMGGKSYSDKIMRIYRAYGGVWK